MIVFIEKKIVLYTPPKCASTSLWEYFGRRGDALLIAGPNRVGDVDHHYSEPLVGYKDFQQIVVVRNPLDRFISLFKFRQRFGSWTGTTNFGPQKYIDELCNGSIQSPFYADNQDAYLKDVTETDVIKFGRLESGLLELGLIGYKEKIPKLNVSEIITGRLSEKQKEQLKNWWKPDIERFGFSE